MTVRRVVHVLYFMKKPNAFNTYWSKRYIRYTVTHKSVFSLKNRVTRVRLLFVHYDLMISRRPRLEPWSGISGSNSKTHLCRSNVPSDETVCTSRSWKVDRRPRVIDPEPGRWRFPFFFETPKTTPNLSLKCVTTVCTYVIMDGKFWICIFAVFNL